MYRLRKDKQIVEGTSDMKKYLEHFVSVFQNIKTKNGKPLSKHTIDAYIARLNRLHVLCTGKPIESTSLDWLNEPDSIIKKLHDSNLGSKKDYLSGVIKLLSNEGTDQAVIKKYSSSLATFKEGEDEKRGDNKATAEVVKGFIPLAEVDRRIEEYVKKLPELTDDELVKLVIVCMYYKDELIPRNDLPQFKLIDKAKAGKKMNDEFNYILTDKKGASLFPVGIAMNTYKTKSTYGKVKFGMTLTLAKVLFEYFKRWRKLNGDYLFLNSKGEPFSKVAFLSVLRSATEDVLGKQQTVDGIRRAIITDFYSKGMRTINEVSDFAKRFLHSPEKNKEYMSVNLKASEDDD